MIPILRILPYRVYASQTESNWNVWSMAPLSSWPSFILQNVGNSHFLLVNATDGSLTMYATSEYPACVWTPDIPINPADTTPRQLESLSRPGYFLHRKGAQRSSAVTTWPADGEAGNGNKWTIIKIEDDPGEIFNIPPLMRF